MAKPTIIYIPYTNLDIESKFTYDFSMEGLAIRLRFNKNGDIKYYSSLNVEGEDFVEVGLDILDLVHNINRRLQSVNTLVHLHQVQHSIFPTTLAYGNINGRMYFNPATMAGSVKFTAHQISYSIYLLPNKGYELHGVDTFTHKIIQYEESKTLEQLFDMFDEPLIFTL